MGFLGFFSAIGFLEFSKVLSTFGFIVVFHGLVGFLGLRFCSIFKIFLGAIVFPH